MKVVALDLGLLTGVAWTGRGESLNSSTWRLAMRDSEAHARFVALRKYLVSLVAEERPDLLCYEELRFAGGGPDALVSYGGLRAVVLLVAAETGTRYLGVSPATWKRMAGLGAGTKADDALRAARARWPGVAFQSADEAVARWIALSAAGRLSGKE